MREDDAGDFGEFFAGAGLERVAASVKEHVGHVDDEAASGIAGLQNGIQLREKLGAKLGFFGFGLRGGPAGFFGFGFGGALLSLSGGAVFCGLIGGGLCSLLLGEGSGTGVFGFALLTRGGGGGCLGFLRPAESF